MSSWDVTPFSSVNNIPKNGAALSSETLLSNSAVSNFGEPQD